MRARSLLVLMFTSMACQPGPDEDSGLAAERGARPGAGQKIATDLSALPDAPAIDRDITHIVSNQFTSPHLPPLRTTADGRVGLNTKRVQANKAHFYLYAPEKLGSGHFSDSADGVTVLADNAGYSIDEPDLYEDLSILADSSTSSKKVVVPFNSADVPALEVDPSDPDVLHKAICDTGANNPAALDHDGDGDLEDVYNFTVITSIGAKVQGSTTKYRVLYGTPVTVVVDDPKTASATITSVTTADPVVGPAFRGNAFFEATTTRDGKLLVGRIGTNKHMWERPSDSTVITQSLDIVYSYSDNPCDVTGWTDFHPVSHAPYDDEVNTTYGFGMQPFLDSEGAAIPDGWDIKGTYPWIDADGDNLFFTTTGETVDGRYDAECVTGTSCTDTDEGDTRGHAVLGLWTHGRMVLLDGALNSVDFGHGVADDEHQLLTLYNGDSTLDTVSINDLTNGKVRVGAGRDNVTTPSGGAKNTTFLESPQHLLNASTALKPRTPRDVVWLTSNGKVTTEVVFDDLMDVDGLIVSSMMPSVSYGATYPAMGTDSLTYNDGWDNSANLYDTADARMQNAAAGAVSGWEVPAYGQLYGAIRAESVGMGGVEGRGLWLDGASGVEYPIAAQTTNNVTSADWTLGVFVDPRFAADTAQRQVLRLPDGSALALVGRSAVVFLDGAGVEVHRVDLPSELSEKAWSHLGLRVREGGAEVWLYVNGDPLSVWRAHDGTRLFQMVEGALRLGAGDDGSDSAPAGVEGWVDELRVFAHDSGPELMCNYAMGTLVGLSAGDSGYADAAATPDSLHDEVTALLEATGGTTYERYDCHQDYSADGVAHLGSLPTDADSVRDALIFPEGPLLHDAPRPDSSDNPFCLTCHLTGLDDGLGLEALSWNDALDAHEDPRRQPMQPPAQVYGLIPADLYGVGLPAATTSAVGDYIDTWLLSSAASAGSGVRAVSWVNTTTNAPLGELTDGMTLERSFLDTDEVGLRVYTSAAVESVTLSVTRDGVSVASATDTAPPFVFTDELLDEAGSYTITVSPSGGAAETFDYSVGDKGYDTSAAAGFVTEYSTGAFAPGWFYGWVDASDLGDAALITDFVWDAGAGIFDGVADSKRTAARGTVDEGAAWPGAHAGASGSVTEDRYTVIAWEVDVAGHYAITDSVVASAQSCTSNGVDLQVWVSSGSTDKRILTSGYEGNGAAEFDTSLGWLESGDVVQVALGPKGDYRCDKVDIDFSITPLNGMEIADLNDDFSAELPARGWTYLRDDGALEALRWSDGATGYVSDADEALAETTATCDDEGVVAAFTAPCDGLYELTSSSIAHDATDGCNEPLKVTVEGGSGAPLSTTLKRTATSASFDADLGALDAGDTIYVTVEPQGTNTCADTFTWGWSLLFMPTGGEGSCETRFDLATR